MHGRTTASSTVHRASTHRTAASSGGRRRAALVPVPLILTSLVPRPASDQRGHRVNHCATRRRAAPCVVGALHVVLLGVRSDPSQLRTGCCVWRRRQRRGYRVSRLRLRRAIQVLVFCVFCAGEAACACLGRDPCDESVSQLDICERSRTPRVSAGPISRPNTNSWASSAPSSPSRAPESFA